MGKTVEHADGEPVKMKKKSKKDKNMTNDLLPSGDGNNLVEKDSDRLKKKNIDKNEEKKRKSESKEDGDDDDRHDKGILVNDDLQKKNKKRKSRHSSEEPQLEEDEQDRNSGSLVENVCDPKPEKKKKKKMNRQNSEAQIEENEQDPDGGLDVEKDCDPKPEKKRKKKKKIDSKNSEAQIEEIELDRNARSDVERDCDPKPEKKKKKKLDGQNLDIEMSKTVEVKSMGKKMVKVKNKTIAPVANDTEKPESKAKSKSKRVSFSGHVEVFPISDTQPDKEAFPTSDRQPDKKKTKGEGLLQGKRFTPEEDAIVKQAVLDYIAAKGLGDDGLKMVLNCKSHKGMKKCWQEIGLCIPYRPYTAVYYRAHILFERAETRSWTPEEIETLKEFQAKHGNDWKKLAEELGKHRFHVKDAWRRIKLDNIKRGKWSQEEYQSLYDLVNLDLQMKVNGDDKKTSKHGMLRDNIPWTAISEKLSTRSDALCCMKWYNQLTSPLVAEKKWADADDYRMIGALYEIDAACADDVDWDNLLEHRPGDICLKRWNQMVKHIGDYGSKSFSEQVDILATRYCPDIADAREDWDSRPVVP